MVEQQEQPEKEHAVAERGQPAEAGVQEGQSQKKEVWKAVYMGSGTFIISKPKRNRKKLRESRLHNPKRRMR